MRILLVEDDKHLGWSIKTRLEKNGYVVDYETDGQAGLETATACGYDLIILDIMLPKMDGFSVCREIRRKDIKTPILMLTARHREDDRVRGLDCGADDYLVKPFGYPELDARIRALIRRSYNQPSVEVDIGPLHIDISKKRVAYKRDEITLTANEYTILEFLALNRNGVVTREMIQQRLWDMDSSTFSNVIEVMVSRIRKKLDPDNKDAVIKTVKGLGYVIKDEKS
jgi:DNA-binding response OmpR family regulator